METERRLIKIHKSDNVAVAVTALLKGERIRVGETEVLLGEDIRPGHKASLVHISANEKIIKYGYPIGKASCDIPAGMHVHTHNVHTLLSESFEYSYDGAEAKQYRPPEIQAPDIQAYKRADGKIGIRNEVWIIPTVGCVNKTAEALALWGSTVYADGVHAWTHPYGCSQMGDDHETTRLMLADLALHPNAASVLIVALGCENNSVDEFKKLLGAYDTDRIRFLVTQKAEDEIAEGRLMLSELFAYSSRFKRERVSASRLVVGMKCGGSDGFSGITANPLVGLFCDRITAMGGTAILTEVPEMFGAERILMERCETPAVFDKTVSLINGFKDYFTAHNQTVYENPSPGNKEGGITTLEDKSLGCVQKGGKAPVRDVLKYGERSNRTGLVLLEGPGNDIVSTTALTASGAHLILFTTGRGTPLGAPVPTLKIASNSALADHKKNWIDFDAGRLLAEDGGDLLEELFALVLDTASGSYCAKNETNGYREIAILKNGVTL